MYVLAPLNCCTLKTSLPLLHSGWIYNLTVWSPRSLVASGEGRRGRCPALASCPQPLPKHLGRSPWRSYSTKSGARPKLIRSLNSRGRRVQSCRPTYLTGLLTKRTQAITTAAIFWSYARGAGNSSEYTHTLIEIYINTSIKSTRQTLFCVQTGICHHSCHFVSFKGAATSNQSYILWVSRACESVHVRELYIFSSICIPVSPIS